MHTSNSPIAMSCKPIGHHAPVIATGVELALFLCRHFPGVGNQLLDVVRLEFLSECGHLVLALSDEFGQLRIRFSLYFGRLQIFSFHGLAGGGRTAAISCMAQDAVLLVYLGRIALGSSARRENQNGETNKNAPGCTLKKLTSHGSSVICWRLLPKNSDVRKLSRRLSSPKRATRKPECWGLHQLTNRPSFIKTALPAGRTTFEFHTRVSCRLAASLPPGHNCSWCHS